MMTVALLIYMPVHKDLILDMLFSRCRDMMVLCVDESGDNTKMIEEIASEIKIFADELEQDG